MNRAQLLLLMATEYWKKKKILIMNSKNFHQNLNLYPQIFLLVYTLHNCAKITEYCIAGYFRRAFIFRYFEEAFFCKNKFLGLLFFDNNYLLTSTHMIKLSIHRGDVC